MPRSAALSPATMTARNSQGDMSPREDPLHLEVDAVGKEYNIAPEAITKIHAIVDKAKAGRPPATSFEKMTAGAAAKYDSLKAKAAPKYAAVQAQAQADLESARALAESFKVALKAQWADVKAKFKDGHLSVDYRVESKLTAFSTYVLGDMTLPPLPLHTFSWLWVIFFCYLYSAFVSLPVDAYVAALHGYVNFVFIAAGGVGTLMLIYGYMTRAAYKFHPKTLDDAFAVPNKSWGCSKFCAREMHLSVPHLIAVGGMLLAVTFIEVDLACYLIPQFVAPASLGTPLAESAKMLLPAAVVLLVAMIAIRAYVPVDLLYLYSGILAKDAFETDFKKGTGKGARFCVLGFGLGMLFLNGALYKAQWAVQEGGLGLPAQTESKVLPILNFFFQLIIWFFIPICFVGLTAIVSTIKRGLWVYPKWGAPNPLNKDGSPMATYDKDAAAAFQAGKWAEFQKKKGRRTFGLWFCSTAVLIGVAALIPPWTVFYGATSTTAAACDVALTTRFIALDTPVGEVAKSITDGIIAGVPVLCDYLHEKAPSLSCPSDVPLDGSLLGLDQLGQLPLDVDKACETAYALNFWTLTMLFGLIVHLPAAMCAWHLINRYTMLMHIKDISAGRVVPAADKKALV